MEKDPALPFLRDDATLSGVSLRQYGKQQTHLLPSEHAVRANEISLGDVPVEAFGFSADQYADVESSDLSAVEIVAAYLHDADCYWQWYDCEQPHRQQYTASAEAVLASHLEGQAAA